VNSTHRPHRVGINKFGLHRLRLAVSVHPCMLPTTGPYAVRHRVFLLTACFCAAWPAGFC
jgi:hypothetical protein